MKHLVRSLRLVLIATLMVAAPTVVADEGALSPEDEAAIRQLMNRYGSGWLENDRKAVLSTLTNDAVLMPGGFPAVVGERAIRSFWWPDDGSKTTITNYEDEIHEVGGSARVAYVRAVSTFSFAWEKNGERSEQTDQKSASLTVVEKQTNGEWKITRRMWVPMK